MSNSEALKGPSLADSVPYRSGSHSLYSLLTRILAHYHHMIVLNDSSSVLKYVCSRHYVVSPVTPKLPHARRFHFHTVRKTLVFPSDSFYP